MRIFTILILVFVSVFVPSSARAADIMVLESQMKELTQTVHDLKFIVEQQQKEIQALKQVREIPSVPPVQASTPQARMTGKFNPEIGAVADMALKMDSPRVDTGGADRVSVRELELVLGSAVDPYSRLDATIAFTEEDKAEFEEAYLTRFELPLKTTARIGRLKPKIGKVLGVHRDSLDTVDEPLVIQRYFGTEGMNKTGVDLTNLLEIPSPVVHQTTFGILEGGTGDGGTVFGSTHRRPTIYGHLKNYWDLTTESNLELGFTFAQGSRDEDARMEVGIFGVDATVMYQLDSIRSLKLQSEVFHVNRSESENLWGGYGLLDFRFHPQWSTGFRFDDVELVDNSVTNRNKGDIGYTTYLTFYQSEFARWRMQFSHIDLATGKSDNQFLVQGTFAIGEHKHKLQ